MRFGLGGAALLATLAAGCGAAAPGTLGDSEDGTAREPIAGGTLDTDHPAVFEEFTHWSDSVSSCTANLIAPNVLLTARHCISSGATENVMCGQSLFSAPVSGSATVVTDDATPGDTSTFYRGADVRVPSDGNDICGFDVALIILKTPVPAAKVTPLIPRIDRDAQSGETYVAVGYGVDAQGQQNPGRMLLGDLDVACLSDECGAGFGVAASEFMGQAGICSGDSGGPALDSDGKIIGIVSRGSNPCATPIYSEVAPWRDFISQSVLDAADAAGYRAPFWAFSGSSDPPVGLQQAGEPCSDSSQCYPGTVCYYDGDPSKAACTAVCATSTQCDAGQACTPGYDVQGSGLCLTPAAASASGNGATSSTKTGLHGADDSCSLSTGAPAPAGFNRLLSLALAAALLRFRKTHRRPPS